MYRSNGESAFVAKDSVRRLESTSELVLVMPAIGEFRQRTTCQSKAALPASGLGPLLLIYSYRGMLSAVVNLCDGLLLEYRCLENDVNGSWLG